MHSYIRFLSPFGWIHSRLISVWNDLHLECLWDNNSWPCLQSLERVPHCYIIHSVILKILNLQITSVWLNLQKKNILTSDSSIQIIFFSMDKVHMMNIINWSLYGQVCIWDKNCNLLQVSLFFSESNSSFQWTFILKPCAFLKFHCNAFLSVTLNSCMVDGTKHFYKHITDFVSF